MINYELGLLIAVFAFVYSNILTDENAIFHGIYTKLYKLFKTDERQENGQSIHWLFMIIMYCEKCVAGQFAFWIYLGHMWEYYLFSFEISIFFNHVFFVSYTILVAALIKEIYLQIKHNKQ